MPQNWFESIITSKVRCSVIYGDIIKYLLLLKAKSMSKKYKFYMITIVLLLLRVESRVLDFERDYGGIRSSYRVDIAELNGILLQKALENLDSGDELVIPEATFYILGGIIIENKEIISLNIKGKILFSSDKNSWPRDVRGDVIDSFTFINCEKVKISGDFEYGTPSLDIKHIEESSTSGITVERGVIDGNGAHWWHFPFIGYLVHVENRPRLLRMIDCRDVLVENILFLNSPYWTTLFENVTGLEVRFVEIINRRTPYPEHSMVDLSALNTDGIDVTGRDVHVHDVTIWTQDDCIAVKDGSENMLFENINASGMGLVVGSIGSSHNRNITFRNAYLYKTVKALYLKFRRKDDEKREFRCPCAYKKEQFGLIQDVLFENIVIDQPEQYAVWFGPAHQVDRVDASSCSLSWPLIPWAKCSGQPNGKFKDITLRNITIINPKGLGIFVGTPEQTIENIHFDNVLVDYNCSGNVGQQHKATAFTTKDHHLSTSDEYVLVGTIVIAIILLMQLYCLKVSSLVSFFKYFSLLLLLVVAYGAYIHVYARALLLQPEAYGLCEHVVNGTVSGNTWPVPSCFSMVGDNVPSKGDISCLEESDYYYSFYGVRWLNFVPGYFALSILPIILG